MKDLTNLFNFNTSSARKVRTHRGLKNKTKMKKYNIPINWESYRRIEVEAENLQQATEKALKIFLSIPDEEYIEDSFQIDSIIEEEYPDEQLDFIKLYNSL